MRFQQHVSNTLRQGQQKTGKVEECSQNLIGKLVHWQHCSSDSIMTGYGLGLGLKGHLQKAQSF